MKKQISKGTKLLALLFLINSILFPVIYFTLANYGFDAILIIYTSLAALFALTYVIYNKGFSGKNVTPEMLPDDMSKQEKEDFIEDGKRRLAKSKWMLMGIIALIVTFVVEAVTLFLIPLFSGWF